LGSEQNAKDPRLLARLGITRVLNVAKEVDCPWFGEMVQSEDAADSVEAEEVDDEAGPLPPSPMLPPMYLRRSQTEPFDMSAIIRPSTSTPNLQSSFSSPLMASRPFVPRRSRGHRSSPSQSRPRSFPANPRTGRPRLEYWKLPWGHDQADLVEHFDSIFDWIDKARNRDGHQNGDETGGGGKVLIHCQCGVSRSASVCIAYVMWLAKEGRLGVGKVDGTKTMGMHDAYEFVKQKSEWIGPNMVCPFNPSFGGPSADFFLRVRQSLVYQLSEYERVLAGPSSPPLSFAASSDEVEEMDLESELDSCSDSHLSTPSVQYSPGTGFTPVELPSEQKPVISFNRL
jgi:hypothetical protein